MMELTDSLGRKVDFKNTIIIMTSNIGARDIKRILVHSVLVEKAEDRYASLKIHC
jgi:ATP-dependent Clp protease ATP-binding subunit ClpA